MQLRISIHDTPRNLSKAKPVTTTWGKFVNRLSKPKASPYTLAKYLSLPKEKQEESKAAAGWYCARQYRDNRRLQANAGDAYFLYLDIDTLPKETYEMLIASCNAPEFIARTVSLADSLKGSTQGRPETFFVHTTRKHTPDKPRIRVLVPLARPLPPEHHHAVSRIYASLFLPNQDALSMVDPASHRVAQLMYFPTQDSDGVFECAHNDTGKFLDWQELLQDYELLHGDPLDHANLPYAPNEKKRPPSTGQRGPVKDPREKENVIGWFCRAFTVHDVIADMIDCYEPGTQGSNRYTYVGASTTNGAVVYQDGLYLYSNHATDPAGEQMVNAFDLLRIHRFGHLDSTDQRLQNNPSKLESYKATIKYLNENYANEITAAKKSSDEKTRKKDLSGEFDISDQLKPQDLIDYYNKNYCLVEGVGIVSYQENMNGLQLSFLSKDIFRLQNLNVKMVDNKLAADYWLEHDKTPRYKGIVFAPEIMSPTYDGRYDSFLNLYRPPQIEPKYGDWSIFREFIQHCLCGNDSATIQAYIRFIAHMLQRPWEKPGHAVILGGKKGTGKDTSFNMLAAILPPEQSLTYQSKESFFSKFNDEVANKILLNIGEFVYAHNPNEDSMLKQKITDKTVVIEPKGKPKIILNSYHRYMFTSNMDHIVPATDDERRYLVLKTNPEYIGRREYWQKIHDEIKNKGDQLLSFYGAMLREDLRGYSAEYTIATAALKEQKEYSLSDEYVFIQDYIQSDMNLASHSEFDGLPWGDEEQWLGIDDIYENYKRWYAKNGPRNSYRKGLPKSSFVKKIIQIFETTTERRRFENKKATRKILIPSLDDATALFEKNTGVPIDD